MDIKEKTNLLGTIEEDAWQRLFNIINDNTGVQDKFLDRIIKVQTIRKELK